VANKVFNIVGWTSVAVFAVLFWFIYLAECAEAGPGTPQTR